MLDTLARSHPDRYTRHEMRGFFVLPIVLMFLQALLAIQGTHGSLWLLAAVIATWPAIYWVLLNHKTSNVAFVLLLVLITLITIGCAGLIIAFILAQAPVR